MEEENEQLVTEGETYVRTPGRTFTRARNVIVATFLGVIVLTSVIVVVVYIVANDREDNSSVPSDPFERAKYLQAKVPLVDGHNDLPWMYRELVKDVVADLDISVNQPELQTDIPRIQAGMLGAQFWSVYVACDMASFAPQATMEQIDVVYQMLQRYPDTFQLALTTDEVYRVFGNKKVASLMGMEGGHSINSSIGTLRMMYKLGARYMTLTHTCSTPWAQSANDNSGAVIGLTPFGREIVLEMNKLGMLVDISHVAVQTMWDTLNTTLAPVIFSHSNAKALCDVPRNVPDDVLLKLKENGGVIMIMFYPPFVCQGWNETNGMNCTLDNVVDHIDHVRNLIGADHIGIGSDFDGVSGVLPSGLQDVSKFVDLTAELVRRNYTDDDITKILGKNILRVLSAAEGVAAGMN